MGRYMRRKFSRHFGKKAILMSLLAANILNSCGQAAETGMTGENADTSESERVTITIFDKNVSGVSFDDAVAKKIMEETGVTIQVMDATANADERVQTMLTNRNYPDIVLMSQGEMVNRYIEAGAFIPLDDLIEEYGPDIKEMYGSVLEKSRYTDSRIYWLANWYGPDYDASAGVLMRRDILEELVGKERAYSTEPFTQSEYTELLRLFKEKYPVINGHSTIALELDGPAENYVGTLQGMFGMKSYGENEDGSLSYLPATDRYKEALFYLNDLYREELLDREWQVKRNWLETLSGGYVFSTWNSYWDVAGVNENLEASLGPEAQFYCFKVVADDISPEDTTYNPRNSLGWDAIGITDKCENPEAAMKVINYLASEEGQYLMLWGIEGETWEYEDGVHTPYESFWNQWDSDQETTKKTTGVRRWTWFIKNGKGSDGTYYDLTNKYIPDEVTDFANSVFGESDYWDTAEFNGLEPGESTEIGLSWQRIENLYDQYYARVIDAADHEEAESIYRMMLEEMRAAGLEKCEEYISDAYRRRMQLWGSLD